MSVQSVSGATSDESKAAMSARSFKCEICQKEFASESQLAFHKDIEHVRHLPVSGVA
jgi:hypothetical protein